MTIHKDSPAVGRFGQPGAEVVAQMEMKSVMPRACRGMERLRAGASIHGEVGTRNSHLVVGAHAAGAVPHIKLARELTSLRVEPEKYTNADAKRKQEALGRERTQSPDGGSDYNGHRSSTKSSFGSMMAERSHMATEADYQGLELKLTSLCA
jgi:hypothetical protein